MSRQKTSRPWSWWLAAGWLGVVVGAALGSDALPLAYTPDAPDLTAMTQPPFSGPHWLGTDGQGRDVLSSLVFGARTASLISVPAAGAAALLGTLLGSLAGYWSNSRWQLPRASLLLLLLSGLLGTVFTGWGAWGAAALVAAVGLWSGLRPLPLSEKFGTWAVPFDTAVLLLIALLTSVPRLVLVLAVAAVRPASAPMLLAVLALTYWPVTAQVVRADMQRIRQLPFIEAARAMGLPHWRIIRYHAWPTIWKTIRATLPLSIAALIGLETTLSFLGVGLPPQTASWGRTLATARLDPTAWWLIVFPGTMILLTTLALRQLALPAAHRRD